MVNNIMERLPSVFIGSSTEGLPVAEALQLNLYNDCEVVIWSQGVFGLGGGTLETLVRQSREFDFSILVLTPEAMIVDRGVAQQSPRDNVLLETGLFIGVLGSERTFIVFDSSAGIKLPSDLAGVTLAGYRPHTTGNLQASLGASSTQIKAAIRKLGLRPRPEAELDKTFEQERQAVRDFVARAAGAWWEIIPEEGVGYFHIKSDEIHNSVKLEDGHFFYPQGKPKADFSSEAARIRKDDKQIVYLRRCLDIDIANPREGRFHGFGEIVFEGSGETFSRGHGRFYDVGPESSMVVLPVTLRRADDSEVATMSDGTPEDQRALVEGKYKQYQ